MVIMGLRNSPSFAQRFMDQRLYKHRKYAAAYIDDIVIFSDNFEDHCRHPDAVFAGFEGLRLVMPLVKPFIGYPSVKLLGFNINTLGLATTEERITRISDGSHQGCGTLPAARTGP